MFPPPEVVELPVIAAPESAVPVPNVFPVCAITRTQARKLGETVDLSDSFFATQDESERVCSVPPSTESDQTFKCVPESMQFSDRMLTLDVTRDMLITAQENDPSLAVCLSSAVATEDP